MPAFFLGLDASKGYADFVLLNEGKHEVEPTFQLDDTFEGHARLYQVLQGFLKAHPGAVIYAAAESTGGYETNFLASLRRFQASLPLQVARLNPARVARHAQASGVRTTTDATSAYFIASYLFTYPQRVCYEQDDALYLLRSQCAFIAQLTKQHTALVNQFEKLLYRAHPQLMSTMTQGLPQWLLKLVEGYPTAKRLARARAKTLERIPFVTQERAKALITAAKDSVASATDPATEGLLREMARQLLHLKALIQRQKQTLTEQVELPQEIALLKSFGSISDYTAVRLLLEIESVERFKTAKKMASFFGVHPVFKQSGDGLGAMRMSKQGSASMRSMLYMITLNAIQHNAVIAPLYARLVDKGMQKRAALGVCMHKTLRILYGLLKHRRVFDAGVEQRHRESSQARSAAPVGDRRRRFQAFDATAPISGRAKKRRRQQGRSQGALGTVCGMSLSAAAVADQRGGGSKSLVKEQLKPT